ncbi:unnamed protein product [Hymenolepis diminuta]|uniref:Uncharacterized protein n=1 Tax=Hymenolepis diminuta TaxID=6216 RepID=A0A564YTU6_HYMDI|nr:unnamed protein product [Hymenolepis diminuta]
MMKADYTAIRSLLDIIPKALICGQLDVFSVNLLTIRLSFRAKTILSNYGSSFVCWVHQLRKIGRD